MFIPMGVIIGLFVWGIWHSVASTLESRQTLPPTDSYEIGSREEYLRCEREALRLAEEARLEKKIIEKLNRFRPSWEINASDHKG